MTNKELQMDRHPESSHISSSRLIDFAFGEELTEMEIWHIRDCSRCSALLLTARLSVEHTDEKANTAVPKELRDVILFREPVQFPNREIGVEAWVFGRLKDLQERDIEHCKLLLDLIAKQLAEKVIVTLTFLAESRDAEILIAGFGMIMEECCHRASQFLALRGFCHVRVARIDGFSKPDFVSQDPCIGFGGTHVFCVSDVAHSGGLITRIEKRVSREMLDATRNIQLHSIVCIDQSEAGQGEGTRTWVGLWREPLEQRLTEEEFRRIPNCEPDKLRLFDTDTSSLKPITTKVTTDAPRYSEVATTSNSLSDEERLEGVFLECGAIRLNFRESERHLTHLFAIDALRLVGLDAGFLNKERQLYGAFSRKLRKIEAITSLFRRKAATRLAEQVLLTEGKACLVVRRKSRGEVLARGLVEEVRRICGLDELPVVAIGGRFVPFMGLTSCEASDLREFNSLILVDCAVRSGTSLLALRDVALSAFANQPKMPETCAFAVVGQPVVVAGPNLLPGLEVTTLIDVNLPPPTERFGDHKLWRSRLFHVICDDGEGLPAKVTEFWEAYLPVLRMPRKVEETRTTACPGVIGTHYELKNWMIKKILASGPEKGIKPCDVRKCVMTLALMGEFDWLTEGWWKANEGTFQSRRPNWMVFPLAILAAWKRLPDRNARDSFVDRLLAELPLAHPRLFSMDSAFPVMLYPAVRRRTAESQKNELLGSVPSRQLPLFPECTISETSRELNGRRKKRAKRLEAKRRREIQDNRLYFIRTLCDLLKMVEVDEKAETKRFDVAESASLFQASVV